MLLFKKKDLLVIISKSGTTVQFTKPLKDILKYQHRYNYKFKLYENGKVTIADDYIIDGETLTVLFSSATVTYTSEGATYAEGGDGGSGADFFVITEGYDEAHQADIITQPATEILPAVFRDNKTLLYRKTQVMDSYYSASCAISLSYNDRTQMHYLSITTIVGQQPDVKNFVKTADSDYFVAQST